MKRNLRIRTFIVFLAAFVFGLGFLFVKSNIVKAETSQQSLLDKEEIDVVIKYIDLTDPNLKRNGIPQIKKDEDNSELKYAVRSVLKNLPWARKIFIVMPNEKVRYFKDPEFINDKIVYIKDKDVLGFDSASSITFEFNFWRLKKFGVSENFVYLNDDYFIGQPLKKSDFFYEENGKIVPYVQSTPVKKSKSQVKSEFDIFMNQKSAKFSQDGIGFAIQTYGTYLFAFKMLGDSMKICDFRHNAMGENLADLKELYDLVEKNYEYPDACLKSIKREYESLQHQTLYNCYFFNKYKRKTKNIKSRYIDISWANFEECKSPLFCINTGSGRYNYRDYEAAKAVMNGTFPVPTPYEKLVMENGIYIIESALDRNKVLDIAEASPGNGVNLRLWEDNGTNAQRFEVIYQSEGDYILIPLCSKKRVDVAEACKENGANIWQYETNGTDAQKWYIIPAENGYYHVISKCNNLFMDVDNEGTYNGTNIKCWKATGSKAQQFNFRKVG